MICWLGMERDSMVSGWVTLADWRTGRFRTKAAITIMISMMPSLRYLLLKMMKKTKTDTNMASRALLRNKQIARPLKDMIKRLMIFDFLSEQKFWK